MPGNDDISLNKTYWSTYKHVKRNRGPEEHEKAVELWTEPLAKEAGTTYLQKGTCTFELKNGAKCTVYASPYQPEFSCWPVVDWTFQCPYDEDRFNGTDQVGKGTKPIAKNLIPDFPGVDIMMTHGAPKGILDSYRSKNEGCEMFLNAVAWAEPLIHCFGHVHDNMERNPSSGLVRGRREMILKLEVRLLIRTPKQ